MSPLDAQIAAMVAEGMSDPAIADRLGLSRQTIMRRRHARGLRQPSPWADLDGRLRQMIAVDGLSFAAAGRLLGRDKSAIAKRARALGLVAPASPPPAPMPPPPPAPNRPPMPRGSAISWSALTDAARWRTAP